MLGGTGRIKTKAADGMTAAAFVLAPFFIVMSKTTGFMLID